MIRNHFVIRYCDLPKNTPKGTPHLTCLCVRLGACFYKPRDYAHAYARPLITNVPNKRRAESSCIKLFDKLGNFHIHIYTHHLPPVHTLTPYTHHLPPATPYSVRSQPQRTLTATAYTHHPQPHVTRVYNVSTHTNSSTAQRPTLTTCCYTNTQHTYHTNTHHLLLHLNTYAHQQLNTPTAKHITEPRQHHRCRVGTNTI